MIIKAKIIGCPNKDYWYSDMVGDVVDLTGERWVDDGLHERPFEPDTDGNIALSQIGYTTVYGPQICALDLEVLEMNTELSYLYRDASNYKQHETVVFCGSLTSSQKNEIKSYLDKGEYFIPNNIDLEDLQYRFDKPSNDDHPWHELLSLEDTNDEVTEIMTADGLLNGFRRVGGNWKA